MNKMLLRKDLIGIFHKLQDSGIHHIYDYQKHRLVYVDKSGNELMYLRLPITVKLSEDADHFTNEIVNYTIILVQSGHSALGYVEGDKIVAHKVVTSYMVRKKQGKSQIKYLKTKGKSRAGSRIRLANTIHFFERINTYLNTYFQQYTIDRIAFSCSKILLPYMFSPKVNCPFNKKDNRIYKIPIHIHKPNFTILQHIQHYLTKGEIIYKSSIQTLVENIL